MFDITKLSRRNYFFSDAFLVRPLSLCDVKEMFRQNGQQWAENHLEKILSQLILKELYYKMLNFNFWATDGNAFFNT